MPNSPVPSDALVFFGATGDLAYKQIFPALQQMVIHGELTVPVIGVAKAGWTLRTTPAARAIERHRERRFERCSVREATRPAAVY